MLKEIFQGIHGDFQRSTRWRAIQREYQNAVDAIDASITQIHAAIPELAVKRGNSGFTTRASVEEHWWLQIDFNGASQNNAHIKESVQKIADLTGMEVKPYGFASMALVSPKASIYFEGASEEIPAARKTNRQLVAQLKAMADKVVQHKGEITSLLQDIELAQKDSVAETAGTGSSWRTKENQVVADGSVRTV